MISSVQGNPGWLQANHAAQASAPEMAGEKEHDGDADDAVRTAKAAPAAQLPAYMGGRIDTLA
ncbi:MAG TPA: hypothetical protein VMQ10_05810 [Spirochaetia bacterium]|nr:hypothetical protein [Spirochaetia bacterium]